MRIPKIKGLIRRRILANFRADPIVTQNLLPSVFKPKLHRGFAIVGVCLIRLENIRPIGFPSMLGISSENAAHRIAVNWMDETGAAKEGVYILRRDTGSIFNHLTGGRVFPGEHSKAKFDVTFDESGLDFKMESRDGKSDVMIRGRRAESLPKNSCFENLEDASAYFRGGSKGFSVTKDPCRLDGLALETKRWSVSALDVDGISSRFYSNEERFPKGTIQFDNALLMENIEHEWRGIEDMKLPDPG